MHSRISILMKKARMGYLFRNNHVKTFEEKMSVDSPLLNIPEADSAFIKEKSKKSISTPETPAEITPQEIQGIWQAYGSMRAAKITTSGQVAAARINAAGQIEAAKIRAWGAFITSGVLGFGLYMLQRQASDQRQKADSERVRADEAIKKAENERIKADQAIKKAENERTKADQATKDLAHKTMILADREKKQEARERLATDVYSTYTSLIERFEVADTMARQSCDGNEKCLQDYEDKLKYAEVKGIKKSEDNLVLSPKHTSDNSSSEPYQISKPSI